LRGVLIPHDTDPDVRLLVNDHIVRPQSVDDLEFSFAVPANATEIRILSRHFVPARRDPSAPDRRRLGICLHSITIQAGGTVSEWAYDDPALSVGFHKLEPGHRWTNGRALVPPRYYAGLVTPFILKVRLAQGAVYGLDG
jgi:hypothetical protein